MADILSIVSAVLRIFSSFWKPLAVVSAMIMGQKVCDLLVPWFASRVIDAMARNEPLVDVLPLIATAFAFWVFHGNVLPYVLGRFDIRRFHYPARQSISVGNIRAVLGNEDLELRVKDTAMQQAVLERGEQVLVDFTSSIFRVAIPISIPGFVTLGLLLWWFPLIGLIAVVGGLLDVLVTLYLNKAMAPMYANLQQLDYKRRRLLTQIFRDVRTIYGNREEEATLKQYDGCYRDYASFGITTGLRFLGFNAGRGVIINIANLCTWVVGAYYVSTGVYSLGFFLASLSWSTYVMNMLGAALDLHKQWLETIPAIRAYFAEIGKLRAAPVAEPEPEPEAEVEPSAEPIPSPVLLTAG